MILDIQKLKALLKALTLKALCSQSVSHRLTLQMADDRTIALPVSRYKAVIRPNK